MAIRICTICDHSELHHFGRACAGLLNWKCVCDGFCARELSREEREVMLAEIGHRRGQIGDTEVLDEYSAIREHLGKVMEKASQ